MTEPSPAANAAAQSAAESEDWSARATSTVVGYVDTVRGKTTGPVLTVSRLAVYFLVIGLLALVAGILLLVLLVRGLVLLSGELGITETGEVWLAYYVIAGLFFVIGALAWRKRGR